MTPIIKPPANQKTLAIGDLVMHKTDLAKIIAEKHGLNKKTGDGIVTTTLESITEALKNGDSVSFIGFGKLSVKERSARVGVNPATGNAIQIPASKTVGFKVGRKLRKAVN